MRLLTGLCDVFSVRQRHRHLPSVPLKPIQAGDRPAVTAFSWFYTECHQPGFGGSSSHIVDEIYLFRTVLVWVDVRAVWAVFRRPQRTVIAFHPAADVLPVCPVPDRRCRDAVFLRTVVMDCLYRSVSAVLFMANRGTPAFRFGLSNSTLTQVICIRYSLSLPVTHH